MLHKNLHSFILSYSWVAQSAEAFLGKIFACSYSIAGCNVISGNPADHLVHRHTHRVVRGSLFVCGRPDGRLTALTTLEASTCLAVNQASSIQSIGGTCESITIGHNMSELPLSYKHVSLPTLRPQFLCEKLLDESDQTVPGASHMMLSATGTLKAGPATFSESCQSDTSNKSNSGRGGKSLRSFSILRKSSSIPDDEMSSSKHRSSGSLLGKLNLTSYMTSCMLFLSLTFLNLVIGAYSNMEKAAKSKESKVGIHGIHNIDSIIKEMIKERRGVDRFVEIFNTIGEWL